MALTAGRLAKRVASSFSPSAQGVQQQSRRWAGDLPVKNNKYIEDWATFRENVEDTFKFDAPTLSKIAIWGVGVPVLLYTTIVGEFNLSDNTAGRKKKEFW